ncbi:DGKE [Cordylochernes scorpioides]|uniref:Diacylglycerol kinase n=1 Tax=Cordylochernes scorpioides TaxID=51811 RepID=A0ABY6LES5_9ARAC|nr:DGKE [Cordylochernes scorpioides]
MLIILYPWIRSPYRVGMYMGALTVTAYVMIKLIRSRRQQRLTLQDPALGHLWACADVLSHEPGYCGVCQKLVLGGWACDACGLHAHKECHRQADRRLRCKTLVLPSASSMDHQWIKGLKGKIFNTSDKSHLKTLLGVLVWVGPGQGLEDDQPCTGCQEDSGDDDEVVRCCWCHLTVHKHCKNSVSAECDFGSQRKFVVPPFCATSLKTLGRRRQPVFDSMTAPPWKPWKPLMVLANRRAGNNDGELLLHSFRGLLHPCQVVDLDELSPEMALQWCHGHSCLVVIGGGDGTVSWVLNSIDKLGLEPQPQVAVLPLGTGNDLARVMGWLEQQLEASAILDSLGSATPQPVDRWKLDILSHRRALRLHSTPKELFMTNYCSVGVDALVALKFHQTRDSRLYFSSRIFNKLLYLMFGTTEIFERGCKNLRHKLVLKLDGRQVALPEVEAVVILNIPSWGAGVRPWHMGPDGALAPAQRVDDGMLEVIGLYSSFHIAQLQVGLSEPHRFGQARHVEVSFSIYQDTTAVELSCGEYHLFTSLAPNAYRNGNLMLHITGAKLHFGQVG